MKRVGPELKMPKRGDIKVPRAVSDLYWDLRDRHLLPIVALLIVAIVAAPILLGGGSGSSGPKRVPPINAVGGGAAKDAKLTVVTAEPGLRNPKKRFAHRTPTNPFKQRFTGPQVANAEENAVETATESGSESATGPIEETITIPPLPESTESVLPPTVPSTPSVPNGPSERGGGSEGGSPGESEIEPGELHYFGWTAKVQISHTETAEDGSTKMSEPEVRDGIKTLMTLPGPKQPVVTFIGVDPGRKGALFVVSKEVTAIFGEAECISGTTSCDLVELEPNFPATFEYGPDHVRWKLKLISTQLVRIKDPTTKNTTARIAAATIPAG